MGFIKIHITIAYNTDVIGQSLWDFLTTIIEKSRVAMFTVN